VWVTNLQDVDFGGDTRKSRSFKFCGGLRNANKCNANNIARNANNSYDMGLYRLDGNYGGLFQRAVVTAETDKFRISRGFAYYMHGFLVVN